MQYQKVDERDIATEERANLFRVAYVDSCNYVEMYDVDCSNVETVIAWAKEHLKEIQTDGMVNYYIAVRNSPYRYSPNGGRGVDLIWLNPYPKDL